MQLRPRSSSSSSMLSLMFRVTTTARLKLTYVACATCCMFALLQASVTRRERSSGIPWPRAHSADFECVMMHSTCTLLVILHNNASTTCRQQRCLRYAHNAAHCAIAHQHCHTDW
eukprot:20721-Heterococcus_DN1.PRE.4